MNNLSILVLSTDSYEDTWKPFFHFKNKNWSDCPFETYVMTEKKDCPYAKTIKVDYPLSQWTKRFREALKMIDTKYVMLFDGDMFIREKVNTKEIDECIDLFDEETITISFEREYAPTLPSDYIGFRIKPNKSPYLNSCQPSIWDREKLIERLEQDQSPWEWELSVVDSPYKHFVGYIHYPLMIDVGYYGGNKFGICKGKWVKSDVVELFDKEGIEVNFDERGFYDEET